MSLGKKRMISKGGNWWIMSKIDIRQWTKSDDNAEDNVNEAATSSAVTINKVKMLSKSSLENLTRQCDVTHTTTKKSIFKQTNLTFWTRFLSKGIPMLLSNCRRKRWLTHYFYVIICQPNSPCMHLLSHPNTFIHSLTETWPLRSTSAWMKSSSIQSDSLYVSFLAWLRCRNSISPWSQRAWSVMFSAFNL